MISTGLITGNVSNYDSTSIGRYTVASLCVRYRGPARAVITMVNRHSREAAAKDEHRYEDLELRSGSSCERLIARSFRGVSGRT